MTGQDLATMERLLKGKSQVEPVETSIGIVNIRPLTLSEKSKVEQLEVRGIKAQSKGGAMTGMEVDMEKIMENEYEIKVLVLSCGLSYDRDHRVQPKEIRESSMDPDVQTQLVNAIMDLSGLKPGGMSAAVDSFRKEQAGSGAQADSPDGVPAS